MTPLCIEQPFTRAMPLLPIRRKAEAITMYSFRAHEHQRQPWLCQIHVLQEAMIYDFISLVLNMTCAGFTLLAGLLTIGIVCRIGLLQLIILNYFLKRLDQYWQHRDIIYDFRALIQGTGSHSKVL